MTISGTPTASGTFNYTVTTTGNGCTVARRRNDYRQSQPYIKPYLCSRYRNPNPMPRVAITDITYSVGGGATSAGDGIALQA
ncbi:MAG: hypothetical protein IPL33_20255 [Sphingobacteriales bacterium]|nr:hypothetical protein [Sphingobacteriales bacterium]